VDANLVVAWLQPAQQTEKSAEAWQRFLARTDDYVAPPLMWHETVSVIRHRAARGLISPEAGRASVEDLLALDIQVVEPPQLHVLTYDLATRYRQSRGYDACYLALAEILGCPLLTLDQRLYNAVAADFPSSSW